jgi:hypothetical protein
MVAPIVLFTYNRPDHTRTTVESLAKNPVASESQLIVYSDAPKDAGAAENVRKVREYLGTIRGFRSVDVIARSANLGLAQSLIAGITEVVQAHGRVIVLEDDLQTAPFFLDYMNKGLALYEQVESVISIHGYVLPVSERLPATFFLRGADCWGWATWKRGWDLFEADGSILLAELERRRLTRRFDFDNSFPYSRMLRDQIAGRVSSWAVRWYASALLRDKLTLYPGVSLVQNVGADSSGTHCATTDHYRVLLAKEPPLVEPINAVESPIGYAAYRRYFRSMRPTLARRIRTGLSSRLARYFR